MSFTYEYGANPVIDYPRLLISDTNSAKPVFQDSEIMAFYGIVGSQFQSGQFYSGSAGQNLPTQPLSYLRVAAMALDSLAANRARLSSVLQLLDVKLDVAGAAKQLKEQANQYRDVDDNAGAFFVIEQTPTDWAFRDRYWKQVQRQTGSGV